LKVSAKFALFLQKFASKIFFCKNLRFCKICVKIALFFESFCKNVKIAIFWKLRWGKCPSWLRAWLAQMSNFGRKHQRYLALCSTKYDKTILASSDSFFTQQSPHKIHWSRPWYSAFQDCGSWSIPQWLRRAVATVHSSSHFISFAGMWTKRFWLGVATDGKKVAPLVETGGAICSSSKERVA